MPVPIFVDTGYIIALINRRDQYHLQAVELAHRFVAHPLLITDAILLEVGNALARSYKTEAIAVIEQFLTADEVHLIHLTPKLFIAGFGLYKTHQDKSWSLVDCISITVMREQKTNRVLTFDRHFAQAGFEILNTQDSQ